MQNTDVTQDSGLPLIEPQSSISRFCFLKSGECRNVIPLCVDSTGLKVQKLSLCCKIAHSPGYLQSLFNVADVDFWTSLYLLSPTCRRKDSNLSRKTAP